MVFCLLFSFLGLINQLEPIIVDIFESLFSGIPLFFLHESHHSFPFEGLSDTGELWEGVHSCFKNFYQDSVSCLANHICNLFIVNSFKCQNDATWNGILYLLEHPNRSFGESFVEDWVCYFLYFPFYEIITRYVYGNGGPDYVIHNIPTKRCAHFYFWI